MLFIKFIDHIRRHLLGEKSICSFNRVFSQKTLNHKRYREKILSISIANLAWVYIRLL
jgi:hypothetical protein